MPGVSAVVLSWRRPDNVRRIVDGWRADGLVDEAIVWNNNPDAPFTHDWATVVNSSSDLGLYTRFAAVALARHPAVLVQDDDLLLPSATLAGLLEAWSAQPRILHGLFGRGARPDGSYGRAIRGDATAPIVLTRALVTHQRHAARFFHAAPHFADVQATSSPYGNGEDIIFSYAVRRWSGRRHRVHDLPCEELPADHAIHGRDWPAHVAHRTRLMQACEAWLDAPPTPPRPAVRERWVTRLSGRRPPVSRG